MTRVTAIELVTLDGVMQAPARPDEDTRGGFSRGGWSVPYGDHVMADVMGQRMARGAGSGAALLFGRRTYADFAAVWPPRVGDPITEHLTQRLKYVVSRTLREPLPWQNSVLLTDAEAQVAELKRETYAALTLVDATPTTTGVIIATYRTKKAAEPR